MILSHMNLRVGDHVSIFVNVQDPPPSIRHGPVVGAIRLQQRHVNA
jgi:hypothetical protein